MSQERIEAAANALATKDRTNLSSWHHEEATAALAAADAVTFSDEAIERAAMALHHKFPEVFYLKGNGAAQWDELTDAQRKLMAEKVRAVAAALKGDA